MAETFPGNFSSLEEYKGYLRCITKIKLGDEVLCFTTFNRHPSPHKTDYLISTTVVAIKQEVEEAVSIDRRILVLGTNDLSIKGFWPLYRELEGHSLSYNAIKEIVPNWHNYDRGYYAYASDIRI